MKLFLDYLNRIKFHILLMIFPTIFTGIIFFLYQLSPEPVLYVALLWLLAGLTACMTGFSNYRKKLQQLTLVATAPDVNLSRMDTPSDQIESLQQDIMHRLNQMRMNVETAGQKSLEEMTDYYTMWAHQIKTPIFALRLLLQEEPERNRESLAQLFRIEQYVEMVLGYLRTEDMSADLKLARSSLDRIIREQIHKYAGIFVAKKLSLSYEGTDATVLTDEKWLGFVIEQLLTNALKYTHEGSITIGMEEGRLTITDTGIGIRAEDLPRVCEKGYTGYNGHANQKSTGIGLYLCSTILKKLGHSFTITSQEGTGTRVMIGFPEES